MNVFDRLIERFAEAVAVGEFQTAETVVFGVFWLVERQHRKAVEEVLR